MIMTNAPRIILAAPSSGSGKTTVTIGLLQALKKRGVRLSAFKCGPDFIDPTFHEHILRVPSGNLDLFFSSPTELRRSFVRSALGSDLSVIEGVMGYYDGWSAASDEISTYQVARALDAPVILVLNARGQALSALASLEGFLRFRPDHRIRGVIFNRTSEKVYRALKPEVEKMGVVPLGFIPSSNAFVFESRRLGLIPPNEVADLSIRIENLAAALSKTVDIDAVLSLATEAPALPSAEPLRPISNQKVKIAVARDEAFCFLYRENITCLEEHGAEIVYFSPLRDAALPPQAQGLLLPGGYPEIHARELSENKPMLGAIAAAIQNGMPCLAEGSGFIYLHESYRDENSVEYPMCGVIPARAFRTERLTRFGYAELTALTSSAFLSAGEQIRAHEFHYSESDEPGAAFMAVKPNGDQSWRCYHADGDLLAGFPYLAYASNPNLITRFLARCAAGKKGIE